jgi:predicted ATPase
VPLLPDPAESGDLVGRAGELWTLLDLVMGGRHRIVTVTGPGGVGKSRLVAELITALRQRTSLPVVALDLSALTDPDLVPDVVAEALSGAGASRLPALERAAAHLRDRRLALVLDCFERLVPAAPFVADLVRRCPGLSVLTTSQRQLQLAGERVFRLAPLQSAPAVELLVARAAVAAPGFQRRNDNAPALAAICRRTDGLPLAIELAAAWLRLLTPAELVDRLDRRLEVLTGGPRDRPPRQRSLRATLESSLDLVGPAAGTLFEWLGAFAGGCRLADLEAVAAALGREPAWVLTGLVELVDTSIVRVSAEGDGSRYTLPDTMRDLAVERLAAAGQERLVRRMVAQWYLDLVLRWHSEPAGPAASIVDRDTDNLRAALRHAAGPDGEPLTVATAAALCQYYQVTGRLAEGQRTLAELAEGCPAAWTYAGRLARIRGDFTAAEQLGGRALADVDPADPADRGLWAAAHLQLGGLAVERRDRATARTHLHAALAHGNRTGDVDLIGRTLNTLGALAAEFGRLDDAERLWQGALAAHRRRMAANPRTGPVEAGAILHNLAAVALEAGRYESAIAWADEALAVVGQVLAAI